MSPIVRRSPSPTRPKPWCTVAASLLAASLLAPTLVMGLPASPRRWVDNLDERCYQFLGNQTPLNATVSLTFLDPVLVAMGLQAGNVLLGAPQKLCVPVEKNLTPPPSDTLPYISQLDWECFAISGPSLGINLDLNQLNPIIATLFGSGVTVTVGAPQQLCVPVYKNTTVPSTDVQKLVDYVDVECFGVTSSQSIAGKPITLSHLNPLFSGRTPENLTFPTPGPFQLCVPVAKNGDVPSSDILPYVEYSDVLCYPMLGVSLDSILTLTQLDPVLLGSPYFVKPVTFSVGPSRSLCVPVEKNHDLPPGTP